MGENKKYYWLKLKDDFFRQREIKKLRKIAGGDTYTVIYLKMMLLSLVNDCKIYFEGVEDTFIEELALELDEEVDNVKVTVMFLIKNRLLEEISENEFFLTYAKECTGSETSSAARVRRFRDKQKALQCNTDVTNSNTEKEKEKEIEKEIEKREKSVEKEKKAKTSFSQTDYIKSQNFSPYLEEKLIEWLEYKKERRESYKETGLKALCTQIKNRLIEFSDIAICNLIDECMANGWRGIIWDRIKNQTAKKESGNVFLDIAMDGDIL